MTKLTGKKADHAATADIIDELFVIGLDNASKPQGARFKTCDDRVISAAVELGLLCVYPASAAFVEMSSSFAMVAIALQRMAGHRVAEIP